MNCILYYDNISEIIDDNDRELGTTPGWPTLNLVHQARAIHDYANQFPQWAANKLALIPQVLIDDYVWDHVVTGFDQLEHPDPDDVVAVVRDLKFQSIEICGVRYYHQRLS